MSTQCVCSFVRACLSFCFTVFVSFCLVTVVVFVRMSIEQRIQKVLGGRPCCVYFALSFRLHVGCASESLQLGWPRSRLLFWCACEVLILVCVTVCLRVSAITNSSLQQLLGLPLLRATDESVEAVGIDF